MRHICRCGAVICHADNGLDVRTGVRSDNCGGSDAQNMFMAMKLFVLLTAGQRKGPKGLTQTFGAV